MRETWFGEKTDWGGVSHGNPIRERSTSYGWQEKVPSKYSVRTWTLERRLSDFDAHRIGSTGYGTLRYNSR